MTMKKPQNLVFFLGGHDLEMLTIKDMLRHRCVPYFDKKLKWGAKASAYIDEIKMAVSEGKKPVLIELIDDMGLEISATATLIDHHDARAGKDQPTSLEQVFKLLELPQKEWSRQYELISANDKGYTPALVSAGAAQEEIVGIRAEDRRAQGVTELEENEAIKAVEKAEVLMDGRLTLVHLSHAKTAAVTDRLDKILGGHGYENLIVVSPAEVNFYGQGGIVIELNNKFGGWRGGELPERGFWGVSPLKNVVTDEVIEFLKRRILISVA